MNEERYEDQPWFDKELRIQKEKRKQEYVDNKNSQEQSPQLSCHIPFPDKYVPTVEELSQSKCGAIDLFSQSGNLKSNKAIELASILASGSGFRESFE
jgi:hypothetical protein